MKHHSLFLILLGSLMLFVQQTATAEADLFSFIPNSSKEKPVEPAMAEKLIATIKKLPEEGSHFKKIELIQGIRAMDGEVASNGEIKILVNLDWQALANHPEQRTALDNAAARILHAVFSEHEQVTKLRVIVRIKNSKDKYRSAAKVFSFTRATWELAKNDSRYQLNQTTGAAHLLSLGDYVILTDKGWIRGY